MRRWLEHQAGDLDRQVGCKRIMPSNDTDTLALLEKLFLYYKSLRADFLLRIAANDNNGRHAAYRQFFVGILVYPGYRMRSHKSARKRLTQGIGI
jgi:hypothetical protein